MSETIEYDLIVKAGRVFCSRTDLDGPGSVAVRDGRIVHAGKDVSGPSRNTLNFPKGILLPGLIDLHAHPGLPNTRYGVDPDGEFLPRGVTTVLSQGDAGADDLDEYLNNVIRASRTRVRPHIKWFREDVNTITGDIRNRAHTSQH